MRKLWLKLALLAILSLRSVVGAGIPICTVDGAPSDCNTGPAQAFGSSGVDGNSVSVSVFASADGSGGNEATAAISLPIFEATTEGPVRPGIISYLCGSSSGGSASSSVSAGGISCESVGEGSDSRQGVAEPTILGTPFQITGSAHASAIRFEGEDYVGGGGSYAEVRVEFYEWLPNGELAPVNIIPLVDVPEPNTLMLALLGGAGLLCRLIHRSR